MSATILQLRVSPDVHAGVEAGRTIPWELFELSPRDETQLATTVLTVDEPRQLNLDKFWKVMLPLAVWERYSDDYPIQDMEIVDDPLARAIIGSRPVSYWNESKERIRSTAPEEVKAVAWNLASFSVDELVRPLSTASRDALDRWVRQAPDADHSIYQNVLVSLRSFYNAATQAGEYVLYWRV